LSGNFWVYWIVTLPLTLAVLGIWLGLKRNQYMKVNEANRRERRRARRYAREDAERKSRLHTLDDEESQIGSG
jgi:hypothetical protein